jgi:glycine betaine/choline ABC-type transport system substrate-binding protein
VFQFKVGNAARARGGYWLDSDQNFRSAANLGVVIRPSAMAGLTQKYGQDLKSAFVGKTIKVIGQVRRVAVAQGKATATRVEVTHAGQILSVS